VPVERVLHAPAVHFKGKGFYNTDYGTRNRQRESAAASAEKKTSADGASAGETSKPASSDGKGTGDSAGKSDSAPKDAAKPKESKPVVAKG
jgi:hypothetical protein